MIAEAIDTALTLGWALAVWLVLCALAATAALYTAATFTWWAGRIVGRACRGAWRWLYGRWSASHAPKAPRVHPASPVPADGRTAARVPSWAHTQPINEETA